MEGGESHREEAEMDAAGGGTRRDLFLSSSFFGRGGIVEECVFVSHHRLY